MKKLIDFFKTIVYFFRRVYKYGFSISPGCLTINWFGIGWGLEILSLNNGFGTRYLFRIYYEARKVAIHETRLQLDILFFKIIRVK